MKDDTISIGIPCGPNSEMFANFLLKSIDLTMSDKADYVCVVGINKPGVDIASIIRDVKSDVRVVQEYTEGTGSIGHGECLDLLLKSMTSTWGVFVDCDVCFLHKNWDTEIIHLLRETFDIVGSEYHPAAAKPKDIPNVIFSMFNLQKLKNLDTTFVPSLKKIKEEAGSVLLDTGCEAILSAKRAGFKMKTLKYVTPSCADRGHLTQVLTSGTRGEEYHLNDQVILTHVGRSLSRGAEFDRNHTVNQWLEDARYYLDKVTQAL